MEFLEGGRVPLVIACQSAEARHPSKGARDDPAPGQKHKAAFAFGVWDYFQADVVFGRALDGFIARVALVNIGQLHVLAGDLLDFPGKLANLRPILLVGRGDVGGQ